MSPLDEIWEWYEVTRDSLRLALRLIKSISISAPLSSDVILELIPQSFQSDPLDEVTRKLQQAEHKLLDDLAVVALWASFEQQVLDHLEQAVQRALKQKRRDRLQQRILQERLAKPRYWPFEEVLDLYKEIIDPQLVGDVKQVLQYRNWVAHGRTGRMPPNIIPKMAYERLKDFLDQLKL
jgi:hypothetical protein